MTVALTLEIKDLVNNALASGSPLLLAVVTPENKPGLTVRGSAQVYSDSQIGLWIRNLSGGTIAAVKANPNVVLFYRSATTPVLQFHGLARVAVDEGGA